MSNSGIGDATFGVVEKTARIFNNPNVNVKDRITLIEALNDFADLEKCFKEKWAKAMLQNKQDTSKAERISI